MFSNVMLADVAESMAQSLKAYHSYSSNFEIRILNTKDGTCSGIYPLTDEALKKFATDIIPYIKNYSIYFTLNPIDSAKIQSISTNCKDEARKSAKWKNNYTDIDMEAYLNQFGVSIYSTKRVDNATIYTLNGCPWNKEHTNKSAFVMKFDDGGVHAACLHDSCKDKNFKDFRTAIGDVPEKSDDEKVGVKELESTIIKTVEEFFIDQSKKGYANVNYNGIKRNYLIKNEDFEKYITYLIRAEHDILLPSKIKNLLLDSFNAKSAFSGNMHHLKRRISQVNEKIYYDLCNDDCTVIKITKDGIELLDNAPILFHRSNNMLEQIKPNLQADITKLIPTLSKHFRISDNGELLLFAVFLVTCFVPDIAHVIVIIKGEKGAAKSTALQMSRKIIDPSIAPIAVPPTKKDDLISTLSNNYMNCFDNVTSISQEISDIICMSSTGGHVSKRGLYSNNDEFNADVKSIVMLNGINVASTQSDLLDRAMIIGLDRIPPEERKTEEDVWNDFDNDIVDIFGMCLQIVSIVLGKLEGYQFTSLPRMADFYKWGYGVAEAIGLKGEDFATAYAINRNDVNIEAINSNSFASALTIFLDNKEEWNGTAAELLRELEKTACRERIDTSDNNFPKSASLLSRTLNLIKSNLEDIGITFERGHGSRGTKIIIFKNENIIV